MSDLVNISWKELIDYHPHISLRNRNKILIKLNDKYNRIYYGVVVKHDNKKNVLIRYLDNPSAGKYWWTGNSEGKCGLDKRQYCCIKFGDVLIIMTQIYKL